MNTGSDLFVPECSLSVHSVSVRFICMNCFSAFNFIGDRSYFWTSPWLVPFYELDKQTWRVCWGVTHFRIITVLGWSHLWQQINRTQHDFPIKRNDAIFIIPREPIHTNQCEISSLLPNAESDSFRKWRSSFRGRNCRFWLHCRAGGFQDGKHKKKTETPF